MEHIEQNTVEEIGKLLREERRRQHVTQSQLAGLAGTGVRFISDLENGKPTAELGKVLKVVRTLGLGMFIFSPWDNR